MIKIFQVSPRYFSNTIEQGLARRLHFPCRRKPVERCRILKPELHIPLRRICFCRVRKASLIFLCRIEEREWRYKCYNWGGKHQPAVIAQAAATVACLAPKGFFLGGGTGEALNEYAAVGHWPDYKIRQAQLAEAISLIRALWTGEKVTHRGVYYQTRQAQLYTLPREPIRLYVSTMVPNSARFAGKRGDGLITVGGEEPDTYRKSSRTLKPAQQRQAKIDHGCRV
jgi:hypothetical protein